MSATSDQTATVTVSAALVARIEQLERALAHARGRGDELRRQRDELERIARLGYVATEASSRLRPLARQAADGSAAPQELAEACAWGRGAAEAAARRRRVDVDLPQAVYREAGRRVAEDLAAIDPASTLEEVAS